MRSTRAALPHVTFPFATCSSPRCYVHTPGTPRTPTGRSWAPPVPHLGPCPRFPPGRRRSARTKARNAPLRAGRRIPCLRLAAEQMFGACFHHPFQRRTISSERSTRGRLRSDFKGNHSIGFLYRTPRRFVPLRPAILPQYSTDAVACAYCMVHRGHGEAARATHSTTAIDRVRRFIGPVGMTESDCTAGPRPARVRDSEGRSRCDRPVLDRSRRAPCHRSASVGAAHRSGQLAEMHRPPRHSRTGATGIRARTGRERAANRARTGRDPGARRPRTAGSGARFRGTGAPPDRGLRGAGAPPDRAPRAGVRRPAGRPPVGPRRRVRAWRPPRPGAGGSGTRTG